MFHPHWHCLYGFWQYMPWKQMTRWPLIIVAAQAMEDCSECPRTRGTGIPRPERQYSESPGLFLIHSPGLSPQFAFQPFNHRFQMVQCRFATAYQPLQDMRAERNRQVAQIVFSLNFEWSSRLVASNHLFKSWDFKLWMVEQTGRGKQNEWQQKLQGLPTSDLPDQPQR